MTTGNGQWAMSDAERFLVAAGFCLLAYGLCVVVYKTALWLTARRMERRERHG